MISLSKYRIFVEKKAEFRIEADSLRVELNRNLHLNIKSLRLINIYDIFKISPALLETAKWRVFAEPVTDDVYEHVNIETFKQIAIEFLPGQFDQRADSARQCLSLIDPKTGAIVKSARLILIDENVSDEAIMRVKKYCINEVEAREKDMSILSVSEEVKITDVPVVEGFIKFSQQEIEGFRQKMRLAMSQEDLLFVQSYFKMQEQRDPTETEIRLLDTYWSDHCRHTTFETELEKITFNKSAFSAQVQKAYEQYLSLRQAVHGGKKPVTLMDMATICGKYERKIGNLDDLEVSDEINACSVYVDVDIDGKTEKWLLMFKNETHNHPTEIEPFGGASTCIGGAIRDPLSGRSYVYQAMRVSGAGDITAPIMQTIEGKLPQRLISKSAAAGYSSYGNQIGLATTHVREIYHQGYCAKRMEVGVVLGAAPAKSVFRDKPKSGDVVIMFGGRTGRDGIGGATGSSKAHNEQSLEHCAAEVQKGNAPEERKIQRLFRNPEVTKLIKKSNDFGAGGVSVAIGELADGLCIDLDRMPVKYQGLNGTELAISESQERMSVVVAVNDAEAFLRYCSQENIEATVIATVTDNNRLIMTWHGREIVNISREFINTNGVRQKMRIAVTNPKAGVLKRGAIRGKNIENKIINRLSDLNVTSQKGLIEMFDSTIGASTVLMPFGGKYQLTETQAGVQKLPVRHGLTDTASILTFGYNPFIAEKSPFHGAVYAILESVAKVVAVGGDYHKIRFSFQEYFEKLGQDANRWSKPFTALLGAVWMQHALHLPAIGGKDSMSGTFRDIHVPPALISFAVTTAKASTIISPEFKKEGNYIYLIKHQPDENDMPNIEQLKQGFDFLYQAINDGQIVSAFALQFGGLIEALAKMSFGNDLGFDINTSESLFDYGYGSFVVETSQKLTHPQALFLGTVSSQFLINKEVIDKEKCLKSWRSTFNKIYPEKQRAYQERYVDLVRTGKSLPPQLYHPKPHKEVNVLIPVFPGSNCDYDTARAFEEAGAKTHIFVFRNRNEEDIKNSISELAQLINQSQILALCGGFSSGDEPDGSGKFIANVLNNKEIKEAVEQLLAKDYLILGICNGFQALIKSGLLPFGKIGQVNADSPTLYRNDINRHVSHIARTRVTSVKSPWLCAFTLEDLHRVAISHGEGKFMLSEDLYLQLFNNHQIAFRYCDYEGNPVLKDPEHNPNGSIQGVEGIISPCGKILGKMGHSERKGKDLYKNIEGNKIQDIFASTIKYFLH
ncbi:MAG: phosphoribosylformylglycinamidine synthase [Bacteroidales bacterium]|jgi:phosphoribosylformylglycinamidine synthase|nr:phosphoribosylformylglycinamidine synthase [Bacteroidales bacterium]